jgi:ribonuclease Z
VKGVKTTVTFLGTATVVPTARHDTASFVINGRHLVDTGWYAAIKMLNYGLSPMELDTVFISHCHHDHYIGLPHILFYLRMRNKERPDRPALNIIGPEEDIQRVVDLTRAFLQTDRFPDVECPLEVFPVKPGEPLDIAGLHIDTCKTSHPVQGLCYKFTDKRTWSSFVYTGDTAYHPPIASFAKGASLLIHEASYGPESPKDKRWGHSGALEAAQIAQAAEVNRLALVHCPEPLAEKAVKTARQIFADAFIPRDGQTVEIT